MDTKSGLRTSFYRVSQQGLVSMDTIPAARPPPAFRPSSQRIPRRGFSRARLKRKSPETLTPCGSQGAI